MLFPFGGSDRTLLPRYVKLLNSSKSMTGIKFFCVTFLSIGIRSSIVSLSLSSSILSCKYVKEPYLTRSRNPSKSTVPGITELNFGSVISSKESSIRSQRFSIEKGLFSVKFGCLMLILLGRPSSITS